MRWRIECSNQRPFSVAARMEFKVGFVLAARDPSAESPLLALKRPAVAPAQGLLTEAVLKHARVAPNRRP